MRQFVLRMMRVPAEPAPPAGALNSVRIFRAGRNFYKLRLVGWILTQVAALGGIVFWFVLLLKFERDVEEAKLVPRPPPSAARPAEPASATNVVNPGAVDATSTGAGPAASVASKSAPKKAKRTNRSPGRELVRRTPSWLFPLLKFFEVLALAGYIVQLPLTYAALRLDYELRWYIVTDRSLRIRSGLWRLREITMSFANIQQVSVTQGPLQRLLAVSDVHVQTAGGGGGGSGQPGHGGEASLHAGIFHGVDNASEIRDLILERLRQFRATGLGDPDDARDLHPPGAGSEQASGAGGDTLAAARELLATAKDLRRQLER